MNATQSLLVCLEAMDSRWELPAVPPKAESCVIGWRTRPMPRDAGVPEWAVAILAHALAKNAMVTFAVKAGDRTRFVHASTADEVRQAFDTEYFDWTQRGQVIFLSAPESPPKLSESHLRAAESTAGLQTLSHSGVIGVLLPGVDGDVAGLYTFSSGLQKSLIASLKTACLDLGTEYRVVTADEFGEAVL